MDELAAVRRAAKRRDTAVALWRETIRLAVLAGHPTRAVGNAAGISHARVLQIIGEDRGK